MSVKSGPFSTILCQTENSLGRGIGRNRIEGPDPREELICPAESWRGSRLRNTRSDEAQGWRVSWKRRALKIYIWKVTIILYFTWWTEYLTMIINPLRQNTGGFFPSEVSEEVAWGQLVWELVPWTKISTLWDIGILKHKDLLITKKISPVPMHTFLCI